MLKEISFRLHLFCKNLTDYNKVKGNSLQYQSKLLKIRQEQEEVAATLAPRGAAAAAPSTTTVGWVHDDTKCDLHKTISFSLK